jgi:hypothetical protein
VGEYNLKKIMENIATKYIYMNVNACTKKWTFVLAFILGKKKRGGF